MVIDGTDPFAIAKPDARLIKLLLRARRFNATLAEQRRRPLCRTRRAGRRQPVLFHAARPPQLSRAGYHPSDPRWAAAARSDGREAPRALTSAACLARSADRARLCLSPIRIQRSTAPDISPEKARLRWEQRGILADPHSVYRYPVRRAAVSSLPPSPAEAVVVVAEVMVPAEIAAQIARLRSPTSDGALPSLRWKVE